MKYYVKNDLSQILDSRYQAEDSRLVFRRAGKIKGDYPLADFTELEVSDEMRAYGVNEDLFKLVDDIPTVKTQVECEQLKLDNLNASHDNSLESACYNYQVNEFGLDPNFYGLLMAIKTLSTANSVEMPPKAKACLDAVDALWADYYSRKGDYTTGLDFSSHGSVPYSFAEVRAESE